MGSHGGPWESENEIKLRSKATSLFDVQRWMFDVQSVRCSFFKKTLHGINVTCKNFQKQFPYFRTRVRSSRYFSPNFME